MEHIETAGFDLAVLSGDRYRYHNFDFEKCGNNAVYTISKYSVKHSKIQPDLVEVKWLEQNDYEVVRYLKKLHDRQVVFVHRDEKKFFDFCRSWHHRLHVITRNDKTVGYLVTNKEGNHIAEIHTEHVEGALEALATYVANGKHDSVSVSVSLVREDLHRRIGLLIEGQRIEDNGNWKIIHWEKVISALLRVKFAQYPLRDGKVIVGIQGYGNIMIQVKSGAVVCKLTKEIPNFLIDPTLAARLFFGPLPPAHVISLPKECQILNHWCPLPLYISAQDMA
jgi:hypothetical protein